MTAFVDNLGRFGARLGPRAGGFLAWWGQALSSWLPTSWRALFGLVHERLLLAPDRSSRDGDALLLRLHTRDGLRDVGRVPWPSDVAGRDDLFGYGLINPRATLRGLGLAR